MSIYEDGEHAPPMSANRVFDGPNLKWFHAKTADEIIALSQPMRRNLIRDYFKAGILYFISQDDPHLKEVGVSAAEAISKGSVEIILTTSIANAAKSAGAEEEMYNSVDEEDNFLLYYREPSEHEQDSNAILFLTPAFIVEARQEPLGALFSFAASFSGIRDFVHARTMLEPNMTQKRANATVAHVMQTIIENDPFLAGDPLFYATRGLLTEFPQGIDSLPGGRYSTTRPLDPRMN